MSPLIGHNVVAEFKDSNESIVKVSLGQSLHKSAIEAAVQRALQELGSSEDLVQHLLFTFVQESLVCICMTISIRLHRCFLLTSTTSQVNETDAIYLMVDRKGTVLGSLVCEQVP